MAEQPPIQRPRGEAIDWSDDDMEALAEITPQDEHAARALWESSVEPPLRKLLDAEPDPNG